MEHADLVRNVAIAGHLHHGKTSFVQLLVDQTHEDIANIHKCNKFTDNRFDEESRGLSIKVDTFILLRVNLFVPGIAVVACFARYSRQIVFGALD